MITKIGHVELNNNRELEYYFDKNVKPDWSGPKVKIASVDIFLEFACNAYSVCNMNTMKPATVNVQRYVRFVITDVKGRTITKTTGVKELQDAMASEQFGYCCGWADGPTKVIINEGCMRLIERKINVQISA
jgi:hypothetical protein